MGIPFTRGMGFLLTATMGKLFTMTMGIQLTISTSPSRVGLRLLHGQPEGEKNKARLLGLSPVSVGVQPIIAHRHLTLIRDMGGHPGNELQIRPQR